METTLLIARLGLAAVLAVAAVTKLVDRPASAAALEGFRVPRRLVRSLSWVLPIVELVIAVALVVSLAAAPAAIVASLLLGVFTVAVVVAMRAEEPPECHCFGRLSAAPVGVGTLLRNVALLAVAVFVAIAGWGDPGASATAWVADLSTTDAVLAGGLMIMGLASVGSAALSWQLLRQNGRLWRRITELEGRLERPLPEVGSKAPPVTFEGPRQAIELAQLLDPRSRTLLVFTDPDCAACGPVVAELARRSRRSVDGEHVVLVGHGDREANRAYAAEHGLTLVMQDGFEAARRLGVTALPGLVLLDADRRFAAGPLIGSEAILSFLDGAQPTSGDRPLGVVAGGRGAAG